MEVREARTDDEVVAALALRSRVFCDEQGVSFEADQDGRDPEATHIVAVDDGAVIVGCAETMPEGPTPLGRLLRLDGDTWTPIDLGELGPVQDLARDSEGRLWIVGGAETGYVARWAPPAGTSGGSSWWRPSC